MNQKPGAPVAALRRSETWIEPMSLRQKVVSQFKQPSGALGTLAGFTMAWRSSNRARNRWTVELLELAPDDRVLEIGYGPGYAVKLAARRLRKGHLTGVDHSQVMHAQASRRNKKLIRKGRVTLLHGSVETSLEGSGPFDKVYSANVAQFWTDQEATFRHLRERMKPGGTIATTFMPRSKNPTREAAEDFANEVIANVKSAGFGDIRTEWLETKPVPTVCILATA